MEKAQTREAVLLSKYECTQYLVCHGSGQVAECCPFDQQLDILKGNTTMHVKVLKKSNQLQLQFQLLY